MIDRRDRFKPGDKVVKVREQTEGDGFPIGFRATIRRCDDDGLPWIDNQDCDCIDDEDYELDPIVDTPLFKALA